MNVRSLVNLLGRFLALVSIILLVIKLVHHFHEIPQFTWNLWTYLSLFGFVMVCVVSGLNAAYIWSILLRGGGAFISVRQAYIITGQTQIGKYLPGNVFHYVGRFALARRQGIPTEAILLSTGAEIFLLSATSASIVTVGLLFFDVVPAWLRAFLETRWLQVVFTGVALLAISLITSVFLLPRVRSWVRSRLAYLHAGRVSIAMLLYSTVFALFGVCISFLSTALWGAKAGPHWYQFAWGFTLAWLLGFATPGAPGGLGIREIVFVGLYGKELGAGLAVGLAVVLRVITSLGDLATFGLAYWLGRQENNSGSK